MVKILSWNTLESGEGGAWSDGWGCPLEIQRREKLIESIINDVDSYDAARAKVERLLSHERYNRIRIALLNEITQEIEDPIDFLLFQECTVGDFWDEPSGSNANSVEKEFFETFSSLYEKAPCQESYPDQEKDEIIAEETVQHVYVRKNSGFETSMSRPLQSQAFVGGCLTKLLLPSNDGDTSSVSENNHTTLVLVNVHGKARNMRDPNLLSESISNLWNEIGSYLIKDIDWQSRIVLCGDWNTQLSDLIEPFRQASGLEPVVGMLENSTATTEYPFFSTNHEDGFLAQYDGCLFFGAPSIIEASPSSYLQLEDTSWNITGFMPKGRDEKLSGDNPGAVMYNNFTYGSENNLEGVFLNGTLLPGSRADAGLSDHLRIYTKIRISNEPKKSNNKSPVDLKKPLEVHQRRPYRDYDSENDSFNIAQDDANFDDNPGSKRFRG